MSDDPAREVREAVDEALREEIGGAVDDAVATGFKETEAAAAIEAARAIIDEEGLTTFDFVEFRAAFTGQGFSAAEAQAAWSELREQGAIPEGGRDEHPKVPGPSQLDLEADDVLILKQGEDSSRLITQVLAEPLVDIEIESFMLESQEARAIVDDLETAPSVPFYVERTPQGFEERPLRELVEKFT